jgi:hypothetical protein
LPNVAAEIVAGRPAEEKQLKLLIPMPNAAAETVAGRPAEEKQLKLLIPKPNAAAEIVAGRPAEEKQLIHALKNAANKTLSAPESPFF